jgi:uncharacterized protein YcbK (DUF882 family)
MEMNKDQIKALQFFTAKEIATVCDDPEKVDARVFDCLEAVRAIIGLPFTLTSLTKGVHVPRSLHYLGLAVDFRVNTDGRSPSKVPSANRIVEIMLDCGFRGIGYYPEYLPRLVFHGDIRGRVQLWSRSAGAYCDLIK